MIAKIIMTNNDSVERIPPLRVNAIYRNISVSETKFVLAIRESDLLHK